LDYGKLRYLYAKREKESKKGQKSSELREVRFRPNIGVHDLDAKIRKVRELIEDGAKVKITVRFRGREAVHQQLGLAVLKKVADDLKDDVRLEKAPAMEGRSLAMTLLPAPKRAERPEKSEQQPEKQPEKQIEEDLADAKT
jgi:translation initiation factor IF-3